MKKISAFFLMVSLIVLYSNCQPSLNSSLQLNSKLDNPFEPFSLTSSGNGDGYGGQIDLSMPYYDLSSDGSCPSPAATLYPDGLANPKIESYSCNGSSTVTNIAREDLEFSLYYLDLIGVKNQIFERKMRPDHAQVWCRHFQDWENGIDVIIRSAKTAEVYFGKKSGLMSGTRRVDPFAIQVRENDAEVIYSAPGFSLALSPRTGGNYEGQVKAMIDNEIIELHMNCRTKF